MSYHYQAYGFNILSELKIDEMIPGGDGKDIYIKVGETPGDLKSSVYKGKSLVVSKSEALITITDVAKFYISKGKTIVVEKFEGSTHEEVKLFLLGFVLGTLLHQRSELILHANVINVNGKAVMLAGDRGAGKSTLTALLLKEGFEMVSDDIALIRMDEKGNPLVYPGFPRIKLHIDSIEELNISKKDIVRLYNKMEKYHVPLENGFYNNSLPIKKLLVIEPDKEKPFAISEIDGYNKFSYIKEYIYLKFYTNLIWDQKELFQLQSMLAANIRMAVINNPQDWTKNKDIITNICYHCI